MPKKSIVLLPETAINEVLDILHKEDENLIK